MLTLEVAFLARNTRYAIASNFGERYAMIRAARYVLPAFLVIAMSLTAAHQAVAADSAVNPDFSNAKAIQARLDKALSEERDLPENTDHTLKDAYDDLEAICRNHLAALDVLAKTRKQRDEAINALNQWKEPTTHTTYTIEQADEAREELANYLKALQTAEAQLRLTKNELDKAQYQLQQQQQSTRRSAETGDNTALNNSQLLTRVIAENVGRLGVRTETLQTEIDMLKAKRDLAKQAAQAIMENSHYSKAEHDEINARINTEKNQIIQAIKKDGGKLFLNWKLEFLSLESIFWEARFNLHQTENSSEHNKQLGILKDLKNQIDDWVTIGGLRLQNDSIITNTVAQQDLDAAVKLSLALQQRIGFAIEESTNKKSPKFILDIMTSQIKNFWQMELYLVEETEIVNGNKIAVYRAVTIGKIINLIAILVIGIWVLRLLVAWTKRKFSKKGWVSPTTADSLSKLIFFSGLLLLVIFGLNTARIPLTALAFLGGALAIGLGFGTQTILKNFMSGLILMFERPLSIGDVVQVAGITGTIKNIGVRASLIQHFDGIETLVPNSVLIENELTNWNLSDTQVRDSVLVGVAYGTPTREVAKLLLATADEHGLVLEEPAPEVRLEDFGNDALMFRLLFWIDTRKSTSRESVASDLRFMIDKAFAEAGIVIAYPQRDVHMSTKDPLQIEIIKNY